MLFSELKERVLAGEVCMVENINGVLPEDFVRKNQDKFKQWTVQDDIDDFGILWIFDPLQRSLAYQDTLSEQVDRPVKPKKLTIDPRRVR